MAVNFFNPTAPEGIVGAQWDIQSSNPSTSRERVASLGEDGDETASQLYGERTTLSISATCNATADESLEGIPSIGDIVDDYHVDNLTLTFSATDFPKLDISAHKHKDGSSHESTHRKYSLPQAIRATLKGGVGVPIGIAGLTLSELSDGFSQVTIALEANHIEAPYVGTPPAIPASDNHDGTLTVTADVVGDAFPNVAEGVDYDVTSSSITSGNTSNDSSNITFIKHLAHDA